MDKPKRGLFITGTDTEVGKTFVTALLARRLHEAQIRVGVYKPVASGCLIDRGQLVCEDAERLWEAAGKPLTVADVCPQQFAAPLAPHLAARAEGKEVDAVALRDGLGAWADHCDIVLVEGVGGLLSPISEDDLVADLALEFGYSLLVVAPNILGVINQTLQTLIAAKYYGLGVIGVVLNDVRPTDEDPSAVMNRDEISRLASVPVLGHVPHVLGDDLSGAGDALVDVCQLVQQSEE